MDYTCIEIRKSDDIKKYFKIDQILFTDYKKKMKFRYIYFAISEM